MGEREKQGGGNKGREREQRPGRERGGVETSGSGTGLTQARVV